MYAKFSSEQCRFSSQVLFMVLKAQSGDNCFLTLMNHNKPESYYSSQQQLYFAKEK